MTADQLPERYSFIVPAPEDARFAAGAFDSQIGRSISVKDEDGNVMGMRRIAAAEVARDGSYVELRVEPN